MTQTINPADRRIHERFELAAGYTAIAVRTHDETEFRRAGHAYDISEGGIRFELDEPIAPGTTISMRIDLPQATFETGDDQGLGSAVFVTGNVVWCDVEERFLSRMALAITRFDRAGDRDRLMRRLTAGRYLRAA